MQNCPNDINRLETYPDWFNCNYYNNFIKINDSEYRLQQIRYEYFLNIVEKMRSNNSDPRISLKIPNDITINDFLKLANEFNDRFHSVRLLVENKFGNKDLLEIKNFNPLNHSRPSHICLNMAGAPFYYDQQLI